MDNNTPEICYIESPTYPILLNDDYILLKKIHEKNIPTGYFYRDFYRKFPILFPKRKGFINRIKEMYLDYMQKKTDRALKDIDIIYLPSVEASYLFDFNDMRALPPAGENCLLNNRKTNYTCIYVGGISKIYGFEFLINSFELLYAKDKRYKLILVCRSKEWEEIRDKYKDYEWLDVHHASGKELTEYYSNATIALMPKPSNEYNELAISVKLFEYMSYGLPVVAISNKATDSIIKSEKIGITTKPNINEYADAIEKLATDKNLYNSIVNNVKKSLLIKNLWIHRVNTIINDLSNLNK